VSSFPPVCAVDGKPPRGGRHWCDSSCESTAKQGVIRASAGAVKNGVPSPQCRGHFTREIDETCDKRDFLRATDLRQATTVRTRFRTARSVANTISGTALTHRFCKMPVRAREARSQACGSGGADTFFNLSSLGGLVAFAATAYYHTTKCAVEALSESLSHEVAPQGSPVTIVVPEALVQIEPANR
jgi:NAD(P)-dependent dehydrogenase (short-subunit alcohol dehydrogenase family)